MAQMPQPLFVFVQMEFPWALGPADGRYLMRGRAGGEPERVLVLQTLPGAGTSATRIMLIDPVSLSAEHQARAWLDDVEREPEPALDDAMALVNRVLFLHRLAVADPRLHAVAHLQVRAIRAGWGTGEELASGRWTHASELPAPEPARERRGLLGRPSRRARTKALGGQERLAALLGARSQALICEELALRARLDLDDGRVAHAALELDSALTAAIRELRGERREDLALRIDELDQLHAGVAAQARAVLPATDSAEDVASPAEPSADHDRDGLPDEQLLAHALGRLEAALRARSAGGAMRRRRG